MILLSSFVAQILTLQLLQLTQILICVNLWVTDKTYRNKRLINPDTKKHPVYLGPTMLHFKKDKDAFTRFALVLLHTDHRLKGLKQIEVDMEAALFQSFKYHLPDLGRLLCVRLISKQDESKLTKLHSNSKQNASQRNSSKSEIVKDTYGSLSGNYYESGLSEASDKVDFEVKFASQKWESLCPTFHSWFGKKRSASFKVQERVQT